MSKIDVVKYLVHNGADIEAKTKNGETPFDICEDPDLKSRILQLKSEIDAKKAFSSTRLRRSQSTNTRSHSIRRTSIREKSRIAKREAIEEARIWHEKSIESAANSNIEENADRSDSEQQQNPTQAQSSQQFSNDFHQKLSTKDPSIVDINSIKLKIENGDYRINNYSKLPKENTDRPATQYLPSNASAIETNALLLENTAVMNINNNHNHSNKCDVSNHNHSKDHHYNDSINDSSKAHNKCLDSTDNIDNSNNRNYNNCSSIPSPTYDSSNLHTSSLNTDNNQTEIKKSELDSLATKSLQNSQGASLSTSSGFYVDYNINPINSGTLIDLKKQRQEKNRNLSSNTISNNFFTERISASSSFDQYPSNNGNAYTATTIPSMQTLPTSTQSSIINVNTTHHHHYEHHLPQHQNRDLKTNVSSSNLNNCPNIIATKYPTTINDSMMFDSSDAFRKKFRGNPSEVIGENETKGCCRIC